MTLLCLRFWAKVDHSGGPDACWPWTASRNAKGYGQISVGGRAGKPKLAHRVGWVLVNGPIPDGMHVLHSCDNPPCCNPADWFLGSIADNNADMVAKGRARHTVGESRPAAKLTGADVLEMRRLHSEEGLGCRRLGRRFNVSDGIAQRVISGRSWRHV